MSASGFRTERRPADGPETVPVTLDPYRPYGTAEGLTTTVPREFVHRAALAEVLLTGWQRLEATRFSAQAQWPRAHPIFAPSALGHYDATIVAETVRQAGLLICHAGLDVPLGHQFLMHGLTFRVQPDLLCVGHTPATLTIDVTCTEVKQRAGSVKGLRYEAALVREGEFLATAEVSTSIIAPQVYERMRGDRAGGTPPPPSTLPASVKPPAVGRMSDEDVVLSATAEPDRWLLRADARHPVFFDHPVDHVPGMVMLEAARQAAIATVGRPAARVMEMACSFLRYTELDTPCAVQTFALPPTEDKTGEHLLVTSRQNEEEVFRATVTLAAPNAPRPVV